MDYMTLKQASEKWVPYGWCPKIQRNQPIGEQKQEGHTKMTTYKIMIIEDDPLILALHTGIVWSSWEY